jgi:hypothetical protein
MSRLPLISASEVLSAMHEEMEAEEADEDIEGLIPVKRSQLEVTPELIDRLHSAEMEHFNGDFDCRGNFHEWHEVVAKTTVNEDTLYVLPYTVIE